MRQQFKFCTKKSVLSINQLCIICIRTYCVFFSFLRLLVYQPQNERTREQQRLLDQLQCPLGTEISSPKRISIVCSCSCISVAIKIHCTGHLRLYGYFIFAMCRVVQTLFSNIDLIQFENSSTNKQSSIMSICVVLLNYI